MTRTIALRPVVGALLALCANFALAADAVAPSTPASAIAIAPSAAGLIPADMPPPAVTLADNPDFDALREAYGRRMDFSQRCETSKPTKAWAAAQQAKDFAAAYDIAAKWLETCPVSESVHLWAISSAKPLNDTAKIESHKRWYFGLMRSVLATGDGKTPATAWKTISVAEEYSILISMQLKPEAQALLMDPKVDKLTARPLGGGDPVILYFNPEWHFVRLEHMLATPKS